jgi:hypothetical protein
MENISSSVIDNADFSHSLMLCVSQNPLGAYFPNDHFAIYISKLLTKDDGSKFDSVYLHELTHLHLFTSTAFGHIQQILSTIVYGLIKEIGHSLVIMSPLCKYLSALHEAAWVVHEGAATVSSHLFRHPFSLELLQEKSYAEMPDRYARASSVFASAVGALLPLELADYGWVAANAIAQWCLNTDIIGYSTNYLRTPSACGQSETYDFYNYVSELKNNPTNRLYKLVGSLYSDTESAIPHNINVRFYEKLCSFDFVDKSSGALMYDSGDKINSLIVNDALNYIIIDEIDKFLPGYCMYKHVSDMVPYINAFLDIINNSGWGVNFSWDDMSSDLSRRANFEPIVRKI